MFKTSKINCTNSPMNTKQQNMAKHNYYSGTGDQIISDKFKNLSTSRQNSPFNGQQETTSVDWTI